MTDRQQKLEEKHRQEMLTSAVTLSDMEIFIFPELMIAGALANLMSPVIWRWKLDPWFANLDKLSAYQKILKVKQYIIDHFVFNLDLDTWGLTDKKRERARFAELIDFAEVEKSNALMGYEGDKYYFDIDIRRHFGLDKYTTDVIPYWKTETVEAMTAFQHRDGFRTGAGECVSLAMLYFAALHIIADVPLAKLFMMATPLHSQNFVDLKGGILTNNRRVVTKNMWNNGTPMSARARRALLNEKVTIVANLQGYVHVLADEATMPQEVYQGFTAALHNYLRAEINGDQFYSFLRQSTSWQHKFYFCYKEALADGATGYLPAEELFRLEADSELRLAVGSVKKLLKRTAADVYWRQPPAERCLLCFENQDFQRFNQKQPELWPGLLQQIFPQLTPEEAESLARDFAAFSYIRAQLPPAEKKWPQKQEEITMALNQDLEQKRSAAEVEAYLAHMLQVGNAQQRALAELAFAAFRDVERSGWQPFLQAALERNPVAVAAFRDLPLEVVYQQLQSWPDNSIYEGRRLAQPDEVFNFQTGDGLEKAICLWNVISSRDMEAFVEIQSEEVCVCAAAAVFRFITAKQFASQKLALT